MNTVAQKNTNPQPAVGQVWSDGSEEVIAYVGDHHVRMRSGGGYHIDGLLRVAKCIGIETEHGRVMVGERRKGPYSTPSEVLAVSGANSVTVTAGISSTHAPATLVASWPLVADGPRVSGCVCQWEHGDRACPVHPTCPECGCVVCECKPTREESARMSPTERRAIGDVREPAPWDRVTIGGVFKTLAAAGLKVDTGALSDRLGLRWAPEATKEDVATLVRALPPGIDVRIIDPRAEREQRRRAISAVLAEDARKFPAFATARRCAVMAAYESAPPMPPEDMLPATHAANILRDCHRYEAKRGGMTKPSAEAADWMRHAGGTFAVALSVYERNRGAK